MYVWIDGWILNSFHRLIVYSIGIIITIDASLINIQLLYIFYMNKSDSEKNEEKKKPTKKQNN